jgi:formylglycine-generating enzyme required for sulfatase activity
MDKYEASVWRVPDPTSANRGLVNRIQQGRVTAAELTASGAVQLGLTGHNYGPCTDSGQNCTDIYAVSLPGAWPSASITWFQAQQACKNSRKRLPSNAEWQAAVAGTPDPGPDNATTDCNTCCGYAVATGSRSSCVSSDGVFDMVGNVYEWVAEWVPRSTACGSWSPVGSGDEQCLGGAETGGGEPGALLRGGNSGSVGGGTLAGPLAVDATFPPSFSGNGGDIPVAIVGFRCAR